MNNPKFTSDWMSSNTQKWINHLSRFRDKPCQALELGSYEGRSAIWFVANILTHADSRITCVDGFYAPGYSNLYLQNISITGAERKINTIRGDTHSVVRRLQGQYDFAYIDADHKAFAVLSDIVMVWPLLKQGAVLILDDYNHPDYDCKVGIDFFLTSCKDRYELLELGWQVIVKKIK